MDDFEMDQQTARAIDGDRRSTVAMLERVARGEFDTEVRAWLQHVAEALLDAESKLAEGGLRDRAIVRAVGLEGFEDKHRELRMLVKAYRDLPPLDSKGKPLPVKRAELIAAARTETSLGHRPDRYSRLTDAELGKIIDAELRKPG